MIAIFALGFGMGLRHAFEADHLAAMATLATRYGGTRAGLLQGAAWGLGHTLTLLLVGGTCLLLGAAVPDAWATRLELVVGFMLLALGVETLLRMRRARIHVHVHAHPPLAFPGRALAVGLVHGLAGSAALFLLTLQTVGAFWPGLAYIALFGLGSILGMAGLSAVIAVPMRAAARRVARVQGAIEAVVGVATIAVGIRVIWTLLA